MVKVALPVFFLVTFASCQGASTEQASAQGASQKLASTSSSTCPEVNDNNFMSEVINANEVVVLEFMMPYCPFCIQEEPILESVTRNRTGQVKVCKVNANSHPSIVSSLNVEAAPTLIIFKGGLQKGRIDRFANEQEILDAVDSAQTK